MGSSILRHSLAAAAVLLVAFLAGAAGPVAAQDVARVELRTDASPGAWKELHSMIAITPGEPLEEEAVRRTLRNLHATGLVATAEVYTRPADLAGPADVEPVVAVVVARAAVGIEDVLLVGQPGLDEDRLRRRLEVQAGDTLVEDRLLRSVYNLQDLYEQTGHPQARVRLAVAVQRDRAEVTFHLDAGPRLLVGAVAFDGPAGPFSIQQLAEPLQAGPGTPYDARRIRDDADRLRRWLIAQGYRTAEVERPTEVVTAVDTEPGSVDLTYRLHLGPRILVEVQGADLEKLERKGVLPLLASDGYDQVMLQRTREALLRHYQGQGHWQARVTVEETSVAADLIQVQIQVEEGPVFRLGEMRLEGNDSIAESRLVDRMATRPHRWLHFGDGRLVQATLEEDLENLLSFYILEGFWDAQVGPADVLVEGSKLTVVIPIVEGDRRRVGEVHLQGVSLYPVADGREWSDLLPLTPGGPYHPRRLQEAVALLRTRYQSLGYEGVRVAAQEEWINDNLVDVTVRVLEGPQTVVDRVVLRGNRKTRGDVLRRFIHLEAGEPVSRQRLLEVERNLSRLGIFSNVQVELTPGELGAADRDVVVRVEEGDARRIAYGLGFDSEDGARGLLSYAHRNLWGRALTLQLDARASAEDQRFRLALDQPYLGRFQVPMTYSLFVFDEDRDSFEQNGLGARVEATKELRLGRLGRLGLVLENRFIDLDNVEVPLNEIEREDREIKIVSLIPNYLIDRRDDPFDPKSGWSTALQTQYAFPSFGTDANFLKLFVQQTGYLDFAEFGVLAGSLRLGAIEPLGEETPFQNPEDNPVPIGERFFAGGRTSHRAYGRDDLGILGETLLRQELNPETNPGTNPGQTRLIPVGGNALVLANLEYRFPIVGPLGGSVWADAGNVWRDWRNVDLGQIKVGAGIGLRYRSPVGPIRLEFGWKLDRETGESPTQFFLSVGNPF